MVATRFGTALGARLGVTTVEYRVEIEVVGVLECSGLFEAPMPPLFTGQLQVVTMIARAV